MSRHTTEKKHLCDMCGKKFKSKVTLKSHKLMHTEDGEREPTNALRSRMSPKWYAIPYIVHYFRPGQSSWSKVVHYIGLWSEFLVKSSAVYRALVRVPGQKYCSI
jgi:hypothetical protein